MASARPVEIFYSTLINISMVTLPSFSTVTMAITGQHRGTALYLVDPTQNMDPLINMVSLDYRAPAM